MQSWLLTVCVFLIVAFFYIHVSVDSRETDECEIIDVPIRNRETYEEVERLRCPFTFAVNTDGFAGLSSSIMDADTGSSSPPLVVPFKQLDIPESGAFGRHIDRLCSPYSSLIIDRSAIYSPAQSSETSIRRNTHCRTIIVPLRGTVKVSMWSPKKGKVFASRHDDRGQYDEVCGSANTEASIEADVKCGRVCSLPGRWWSSLYMEPDTVVAIVRYRSLANLVSNLVEVLRWVATLISSSDTSESVLSGIREVQ